MANAMMTEELGLTAARTRDADEREATTCGSEFDSEFSIELDVDFDSTLEVDEEPLSDPEQSDEFRDPLDESGSSDGLPVVGANLGDVGAAAVAACEAAEKSSVGDDHAPEIAPTKTLVAKDSQSETYLRIIELEREISELCIEEQELKEAVKSAKESREGLVDELRSAKARYASPQQELPFNRGTNHVDGHPKSGEQVTDPLPGQKELPLTEGIGVGGANGADYAAAEFQWGRESVECFAKFGFLTEKKIEALVSCGKFDGTVRGLRDWISKYELWHRDIKGFGPTWADKVSDSLNSYYRENPLPENPNDATIVSDSAKKTEVSGSPKNSPSKGTDDDVSSEYSRDELDLVFAAGSDAALEGITVAANPHKRGTELWHEWDRGWQETN